MATINITSDQLDRNKLEAIKAFLKALKIKFEISNEQEIPQWQKDELDICLKEHEEGKAQYIEWKSAKKILLNQRAR